MDNNLDLSPDMFRSGANPKTTNIVMQRRTDGPVNTDGKYTEIGGNALFEGDIVLATIEEVREAERRAEAKGIGIIGENFRWPDGVVPYVIASEAVRERVEGAIAHWQERTPFQFIQRTVEAGYISFEEQDGCWSRVGHHGTKQVISLGPGCGLGAAIHEIGHALGLWHEQSRSDRDDFIEIVTENIDPDFIHNFDKHIQDGKDLGKYDHGSIMHYPATAFSINGKPTIRAKGGQPIGQREGLSEGDINAMRLMYPDLAWNK
jgi:hypothetical protein